MSLKMIFLVFLLMLPGYARATCSEVSVKLQVLGSGGPELDDGRTSSSYLVWIDGKARLLIDTGPGSSIAFGNSGADFADLDAIMLTHLHVDHAADLPAYVKGAFFTSRVRDLTVFGPAQNALMPSTSDYISRLLSDQGAFRYLREYVDDSESAEYQVNAIDVQLKIEKSSSFEIADGLSISALPVHHGPVAAVSWRVNIGECSIVVSGDMSGNTQGFGNFAQYVDLLVMHNAIPEQASEVARNLHMTPSEIGQFAKQAEARKLIISHRMKRTNGKESETTSLIRKQYLGPILFADDMDSFKLSL